jgi:DNA polymerase V
MRTLDQTIITLPPSSFQRIPLFISPVRAGFPSPAEDHIKKTLDFNELLVRHPIATFCLRVSGDSMIGAGIHDGDLLIVDRALPRRTTGSPSRW